MIVLLAIGATAAMLLGAWLRGVQDRCRVRIGYDGWPWWRRLPPQRLRRHMAYSLLAEYEAEHGEITREEIADLPWIP